MLPCSSLFSFSQRCRGEHGRGGGPQQSTESTSTRVLYFNNSTFGVFVLCPDYNTRELPRLILFISELIGGFITACLTAMRNANVY